MPKLKAVTFEELKAAEDLSFDLQGTMSDLSSRMQQGYCGDLNEPLSLASSFLSLSRAAGEMAANLLVKAKMDEMRREAERLIKMRTEG